jgi:hypothetical protein
MPAQRANLAPHLQRALDAKILSLSEAWMLQDVILIAPPGCRVELSEEFEPVIDKMMLFEAECLNDLPA